jgi:hypothetical protein
MLEQRWTAGRALLRLLGEFHRGSAGRLVDQDEADFHAARAIAGMALCTLALGDVETAAEQHLESGRVALELIGRAALGRQAATLAAMHTGGDTEVVFRRGPTLSRMAEWYDLAALSQRSAAELLMELDEVADAGWLLGMASQTMNAGPKQLVAALDRDLPLRVKANVALVNAWQGLRELHSGSGVGADVFFLQAHGSLATILSFIPDSVVLRRELAVLEGRRSQAMLLARAPGAAVHWAMRALARLDSLCHEEPAFTGHRLDRAFALRCLAEGWRDHGVETLPVPAAASRHGTSGVPSTARPRPPPCNVRSPGPRSRPPPIWRLPASCRLTRRRGISSPRRYGPPSAARRRRARATRRGCARGGRPCWTGRGSVTGCPPSGSRSSPCARPSKRTATRR